MKKLVAILILFYALPTIAGDFSIKGFELGVSRSEFKPFDRCEQENTKLRCHYKNSHITVGNEEIGIIMVTFVSDISTMVVFDFKTMSFDSIKTAIHTKYPRLNCKTTTLQNRMGATFENQTCEAETDKETLRIDQRAGRVDSGALIFATKEYLTNSSIDKKKKAASDI